MRGSLAIACAQMRPILGDVAANTERLLAMHQNAASAGADLVISPELALTGYFLRDCSGEVAQRLDAPPLTALREATRSGPDLICSFVEEMPDYRLCISAAHLHAGHVLHIHRKVYLPTYGMFEDERYFAAGHHCRAYDTPAGRAGLLICEDWLHPMLPTLLALDGAHLLFGCSASPDRGFLLGERGNLGAWRDQLVTFAGLLGCAIAWCNRVGYEDGVHFGGRSVICDASGRLLAEGDPFEEELVMASLDLSEVRRARVKCPVTETENLALTLRELERINAKTDAIAPEPLPEPMGLAPAAAKTTRRRGG